MIVSCYTGHLGLAKLILCNWLFIYFLSFLHLSPQYCYITHNSNSTAGAVRVEENLPGHPLSLRRLIPHVWQEIERRLKFNECKHHHFVFETVHRWPIWSNVCAIYHHLWDTRNNNMHDLVIWNGSNELVRPNSLVLNFLSACIADFKNKN